SPARWARCCALVGPPTAASHTLSLHAALPISAEELRGVAEAAPLHVIVGHLGHQLGTERLPPQALAAIPAADGAGAALLGLLFRRHPAPPRVSLGRSFAIGREKLHQLRSLLLGEARGDADVLQVPFVVVEAEEERSDHRARPV